MSVAVASEQRVVSGGFAGLFMSVSRLHIIAIAMMGTLTFGWLFTGQYLWLVTLICGVDWFVVNLLNRVVDLEEDEANGIVGTGFVHRYRPLILVLGFGVLVGSFVLTHWLVPAITLLRVAYQLLGFAYNWPIFPGGRRIKELYFFKNTSSGIGFLLTVFAYPLVAAGSTSFPPGITAASVVVAGAFFLLFELSYEAIYDLRDAPGDAVAGVRSYAVVHGEKGAVRFIDTLIVSSMIALAAGYALGVIPWRIFIMIVAPVLQLVLYKRAYARGITAQDCIAITWLGAGLLAAYHLWIWAGLPGVGI